MKVLLDEHVPHDLRPFLAGHESFTVTYLGWNGLKNGALLIKAASENFAVMITNDEGIRFEQDQSTLPIAVLYLGAPSNRIEDIQPMVPRILRALSNLKPHRFNRLPD